MKYKILNGLCVPVTTPDNYFKQSAQRWMQKHRQLVQAGRNLRQLNIELEHARTEYEEEK